MNTVHARRLAVPLLLLSAHAFAGSGPGELIAGAKPILDVRYRYEHVAQDNALRDADAHTVRTRLGFRTGTWRGFSALAEYDHVGHPGGQGFNDSRNGRTELALVPDPDGGAVNQAFVRHSGDYGSLTLGRQRINLGNQRFVGNVGWRQNEQTYDGALLQLAPTARLALSYAWIGQVNSVFGPSDGPRATRANPARIDGDSHLLDLRYRHSEQLSLSAYYYRLDLEDIAIAATAPSGTLAAATSGVRVEGSRYGIDYALEYARQRDLSVNPWRLDSRYRLVEIGRRFGKVQVKLGREVLGSGGGAGNRAFQTPLATKHAFQGWADSFLTTPADGLEDRYLSVSAPLAGGSLQLWQHDFSAERGGMDYGRETDLSYARPVPGVKGLTGLVKFARYDAGNLVGTVDTDKFWVQLQYAY